MKHIIITLNFVFFCCLIFAQNPDNLISKGNEAYRNKKYSDAINFYRKALEKDSPYHFQANYNLANALYNIGKNEESREIYSSLINDTLNSKTRGNLYHNIGNTFMKEKDYASSVGAYKNALKNNPTDEDSRYNLSYALKMLKQNQNNNQNKNQQDKNQQDKNQQDKNQNKQDKNQQDKKDNNQGQNQDKKDSKDSKGQGQQAEQKINKSQAEKMLKAIATKEKETQKKLTKKADESKVGVSKDW